MNDATYETQKARIMALSEKWVHSLGFGTWTVTYEWHREFFPSEGPPLAQGDVVLFHISTEWEYMRVYMKVNLHEVEAMNNRNLEDAYLHEWGHAFLSTVLTTPKGEARFRAVEHVATWMGQAFQWVRIAGMADEKKHRKAKKKAKAKADATAKTLIDSTQGASV